MLRKGFPYRCDKDKADNRASKYHASHGFPPCLPGGLGRTARRHSRLRFVKGV